VSGSNSHRRRTARTIIMRVIADNPTLKTDLHALFKVISKAYPWGERRLHPYKMWCKEVGLARRALERDLGTCDRNPYYVKCDSCGARPAQDCRPLGSIAGSIADDLMVAHDAELEGRVDDAAKIRQRCFHEARLIAVGLKIANDTLPLFGVP